ncbi:helix-turn-helix domain-containing protein [Rhizohabitans arisaemae]|uniref:helix-turn-helix domain-containing protein n=1 Tax=Rhizohabitans arisaemae TaxID=2720610 RepID=UPI0024B08B61|nr:helix-turn-helix domain-containing protein [Rhizohabitans arisaemae]
MTESLGAWSPESEHHLLELGLERLRSALGAEWKIEMKQEPAGSSKHWAQNYEIITVKGPDQSLYGEVLVETMLDPTPARLQGAVWPRLELLKRLHPNAAAIVIAPWISPRTRDMLADWDCGYLDLTGNISFRMDRPAVVIRTQGSERDPRSRTRGGTRGLSGAKAVRLIRVLTDVRPPYRAVDLATATGLSNAYVSRLLDVLEEEGLIKRRDRVVTRVDWVALLRSRASQTALLKPGRYTGYIAPGGVEVAIAGLRDLERQFPGAFAVTGPAAALAIAPLAIGGQTMLHATPKITNILAKDPRLIATDQSPDLLVLTPPDPIVFFGLRQIDGLPHVALSQLVLDCLSGPGRLPAAGESVVDFMREHEKTWRRDGLETVKFPTS